MFLKGKIRKRKGLIQTIQYNIGNLNEVIALVGSENVRWCPSSQELWVVTVDGVILVSNGSCIVRQETKYHGYTIGVKTNANQ